MKGSGFGPGGSFEPGERCWRRTRPRRKQTKRKMMVYETVESAMAEDRWRSADLDEAT